MEMAKLLEAGFDIRKAAGVLIDTRLPAPQARMLEEMNQGLDAGESITAAFSKNAGVISSLERGIISAGERGGKLAPAFRHLSDYFGMLSSVRQEIIKSMIYPVVVLHVGVVVGIVPLALMKGTPASQILIQLAVTLLVMYGALALLFFGARSMMAKAETHASIDSWLNRIPWIGKTRKNMAMARFSKVYHSCLLAGIPMRDTISMATGAARSGRILTAGNAIAKRAAEGNPLGPVFMAHHEFPVAFSRSYSTGEEAGTLDSDMAHWADWFQKESESSAKNAAVMIPKLLYFLILLFVGWKIVGFFYSYYSGMFELLE